LELPWSSVATLQERMFPKTEKVSKRPLLSTVGARFLTNTLPTPDLRKDGSRCDHMMRHGRALMSVKFIVSKARSASCTLWKFT